MDHEIDVLNGDGSILPGSGSVAKRLLEVGFNANALCPYVAEDGKTYITVFNKDGEPIPQRITTNDATLLKDEWIRLEKAVLQAAKPRLRAIKDLRDRNLVLGVDGMRSSILQYQTQSDISDAEVTMDGLRKSAGDRPVYGSTSIPLPIIHKDFSFSLREIQMSRNGIAPLDTTTAQLAGRKVAEVAEKLVLGNYGTYTFAGANVYGYLNFPNVNSASISDWSDSSTVGTTVLNDVLTMKSASKDAYHYGPWVLYVSDDFSDVMEEDFKAESDKTVRQRLLEVEGIEDVRTLDYLTDSRAVLVEMDPVTIQLIEGMQLRTVQWPTDGGMRLNFKVMAIWVPQIKADYNDTCGIVVGTAS